MHPYNKKRHSAKNAFFLYPINPVRDDISVGMYFNASI